MKHGDYLNREKEKEKLYREETRSCIFLQKAQSRGIIGSVQGCFVWGDGGVVMQKCKYGVRQGETKANMNQ